MRSTRVYIHTNPKTNEKTERRLKQGGPNLVKKMRTPRGTARANDYDARMERQRRREQLEKEQHKTEVLQRVADTLARVTEAG